MVYARGIRKEVAVLCAGLDSADLISQLRASHAHDAKSRLGVDVLTGGAGDMDKLGIFESFKVCTEGRLSCKVSSASVCDDGSKGHLHKGDKEELDPVCLQVQGDGRQHQASIPGDAERSSKVQVTPWILRAGESPGGAVSY